MIKNERGFTLVELIIATAISGLIIGVLGTVTFQIFNVTSYGNDKMLAMHELQNVAHWVTLDGQKASTATGGSMLALTLPDSSSITYTVNGTELRRTADGSQMTLAQNISSANFSTGNRTITMNLTSSPTGRWDVNEQGTYKIYLRPTEGGG